MNYRKLVPFLFLIGFFYYLITPIGVFFFLTKVEPNYDYIKSYDWGLLKEALHYFNGSNIFNLNYFVDLIAIVGSFLTGYFLALRYTSITQSNFDELVNFKFGYTIIKVISLTSFIVLIIFLNIREFSFFEGYKNFNVIYLGLLSSYLLLLTYFYVFFRLGNSCKMILLLIFFISLILLGSGSRNIVLYSLIPVFITNQSLHVGSNKRRLFILGFFMLIMLVLIGIWRLGYELSISAFINHLFIDSFNVMAGSACYFDGLGARPIFNIPNGLLAGVVNLLPSIIYPEKFEWIQKITYDPAFCSPFGASSILMSMYQNFGIFYPIYFIFIGGIFGSFVVKASYSSFYISILIINLPFLLFEIFNQTIYAQFKLVFYNGMLIPFCVMAFLLVIKKIVRFSKLGEIQN